MEQNGRKRPNSEALNAQRLPLAETSSNLPQPVSKKPKLKTNTGPRTSARITSSKENSNTQGDLSAKTKPNASEDRNTGTASTSAAAKSARLVGEELKSWQSSWRKIMRDSVVYFDTQGCDSSSSVQNQELRRAQKALRSVGCEIVPFYDRDVSIIVSRRPYSNAKSYQSNDIFHDVATLKIKVWDFDKVFRFLKNLGVSETATQERTGNLSNLLKEEKIFGSADKDPNARRDDLYYLGKNFIYVYDLSQAVRPIIVREWPNNKYPVFHMTLDGKCPFIPDTSDNSERKKLRRLQKFEATKEYRAMLKKVSNLIFSNKRILLASSRPFSGTSTSTDSIDKDRKDQDGSANDTIVDDPDTEDALENCMNERISEFRPPSILSRNSSVIQPVQTNASNSRFYDVAASGYNGASNAIQFSMDSTLNSVALQNAPQGNGLGPVTSQVPSKNLNNLKRRIFMKRQLKKVEDQKRDSEAKPGYCENCRVKYDNFGDHITSNRHRNFACNDENFRAIDDLINTLNESKSMGYVTSNGDYSFTS